jgi:leucyl aminopeptidase (aminopeptidase T)
MPQLVTRQHLCKQQGPHSQARQHTARNAACPTYMDQQQLALYHTQMNRCSTLNATSASSGTNLQNMHVDKVIAQSVLELDGIMAAVDSAIVSRQPDRHLRSPKSQ